MTIIAAADGSALGNPGPAGWGWYINDQAWACGGWAHGTNNMGELKAVADLLAATASTEEDLEIFCDSQYVINSVTKWMPGWKKKGWKKADGKPVLNQELLAEIDALLVGRKVKFTWVKGHAGHNLNEKADDLARGAATAYANGTSFDAGPGYGAADGQTRAPGDGTQMPVPDGGTQTPESITASASVAPEDIFTRVSHALKELDTKTLASPVTGSLKRVIKQVNGAKVTFVENAAGPTVAGIGASASSAAKSGDAELDAFAAASLALFEVEQPVTATVALAENLGSFGRGFKVLYFEGKTLILQVDGIYSQARLQLVNLK